MIELRPFSEPGAFRNDWLNTLHRAGFGGYHDPSRMGVVGPRVWHDGEIGPGTGFDPRRRHDMDIATCIVKAAITHRDKLGDLGRTGASDVQVVPAGMGIVRAEHNL